MTTTTKPSADFIAQHFLNYMFRMVTEENRKHIQRVASWFGLLALAIHVRCDECRFWHERQLVYRIGEQWYKVRFSHKIRPRGGIEIVEFEGTRDGRTVIQFSDLADVERFYLNAIAACAR